MTTPIPPRDTPSIDHPACPICPCDSGPMRTALAQALRHPNGQGPHSRRLAGPRCGSASRHRRRYRSAASGGDQGGATVFACVALAGLICSTLMVGQVGAVVVARHRVQAAADLGALAAAGALVEGAEVGCAEAGDVARRMGARVSRCEVAQWDAVVTVERQVGLGVFGVRSVVGAARAGPVEESG
ncbi:Rv3654c family TadE-like protein [Nocardia sp. NPDC023988]|uniref:Rv3654c family TadE-like protein n=1 Tax=unclassified Nocardia TaxID=2637762 RepID=UPI0033C60929